MAQTCIPHLAAPVERTITGAAATQTAGVDQSEVGSFRYPFADDGDE
ncbi:hypothetical protein [Streptosporangium jomthongense]|uniref:Uncharacterized protein n=1 Tax=Streptosporangium jomthongense TaxID=1193683 RepID=A0ABV8F7W4_9ACTN